MATHVASGLRNHRLGRELGEMVALWLAILLTQLNFHRVNRPPGFGPRLIWLGGLCHPPQLHTVEDQPVLSAVGTA